MDFSDGNTEKFRNPYATFKKNHVSQRGKSDRHQRHNLEYEQSHRAAQLERWYKKVTTPKPDLPSKPIKKAKAPIDYGPIRERRRIESIPRQQARIDAKAKKLNAYKRYTHWVARSLDEYNQMHSLII